MTILHDKPNIKHEEQTKNSGGEVTNNKHSIGCSSDAQDMVENELQVEAPDERDCIFSYLNLTTHNSSFLADPVNLDWCQERPEKRGPVVATTRHPMKRNAIGAHSGSYCIYRALAIACGELDAMHVPELSLTSPVMCIGPFPSWSDPSKIATIDPWGHVTTEVFSAYLKKGYDIRPTIAITRAHIDLLEIHKAVRAKRLVPDGKVLNSAGQAIISKAAVEPVWYLPELANRFGVSEMKLRETLFMETNLMYPELITRPDLKVFLPPIGGLTIYMFGDPATISDENIEITVRVHDECNGSDVFGSDICTCRPYLTHAIEECIKTAQRGGNGVIVYFRKEGRALGEVTKYLAYNSRKRQEGGDTAFAYFRCTEQVAGIQDTRFQALMPDALHWLGISKIDNFVSMSNVKYEAIVQSGIEIVNRIEIPEELIPPDAQVELSAKVLSGYHTQRSSSFDSSFKELRGRTYGYGVRGIDDQ